VNVQTKANLRKMWLRVTVTLIGAFGVIFLLSLLAAEEDPASGADCPPPEFACSQALVEAWLGFPLPETAEGVQYSSDSTRDFPTVWLRFDAPSLDVTEFLDAVSVNLRPDEVAQVLVEPPTLDEIPWWYDEAADPATELISDRRNDRYFFLQLDQRSTERWVVYMTGIGSPDTTPEAE
jgi:hypothetical protein